MAKDRRISCSVDAEYQRFRAGAWAVGAIFGIAGPLACIIYGLRFSTGVFQYLTDGLKPRAWFWELVTMFRKSAILAIVTIIPQQSAQLMSYVVFNYFFLMLTMYLRPYDGSHMYNVLECFGTSTMVVVALLLMLTSSFPSVEYAILILMALVVFFSLLTLLAVAIFLLRAKSEPYEGTMEFEFQPQGCDTKFYVGLRSLVVGYPRVSHGQNIKSTKSGVTGTVVGTDTPNGVLYWKKDGSDTWEICAKNADEFEEEYTCSLEGTYTQYVSPDDLAKKANNEDVKNQEKIVPPSPRQAWSGGPREKPQVKDQPDGVEQVV